MITKGRGISVWSVLLLLAAAGFAVYSNSIAIPFVFDDEMFIETNRSIQALNIVQLWNTAQTRFFSFLSFALNFRFFGLSPTAFRIVNIVIHVFNSLLIFLILGSTFKTPLMRDYASASRPVFFSMFGAFVFLCHPLQTQAVVYISQRMTSLACLFYLGALYLYIQGRLSRGGIFYVLAAVSCTVAFFTKQNTYTLPMALLLYDMCFFRERTQAVGSWRARVPLIVFGGLLAPVYVVLYAQKSVATVTRMLTEIPRMHYLLTEFSVVREYIRLVFLPLGLSIDHDFEVSTRLFETRTAMSLFFLAALFCLALWLWRRRPMISFGILWFFLALSIESSIIPINDFMFEHRVYLPMAGICFLIPDLLIRGIKRREFLYAAAAVLIFSLAGTTYARNRVWRSGVSLWQDAVDKAPGSSRARTNLGKELLDEGRFEEAKTQLLEAVRLNPDHPKAYNLLGGIYAEGGDRALGLRYLEKAVAIDPTDPDFLYNLGSTYGEMGDNSRAQTLFEKALAEAPDHVQALTGLGLIYYLQGDLKKAVELYRKALVVVPEFAVTHYNLGLAQARLGDHEEAIRSYERAVRFGHEGARLYSSLGIAYRKSGQLDRAVPWLNKALEADPSSPLALYNLGVVYGEKRNIGELARVVSALESLGHDAYAADLKTRYHPE
ncbi:MAG: tetratricopeptide repeat protein [Candidatus Omnitrophota bacterium]|nr:tetratricopeptide repeat protein [Candidatus Omnitrophota bacterium]